MNVFCSLTGKTCLSSVVFVEGMLMQKTSLVKLYLFLALWLTGTSLLAQDQDPSKVPSRTDWCLLWEGTSEETARVWTTLEGTVLQVPGVTGLLSVKLVSSTYDLIKVERGHRSCNNPKLFIMERYDFKPTRDLSHIRPQPGQVIYIKGTVSSLADGVLHLEHAAFFYQRPTHFQWMAMTSNDPLPSARVGLYRDSEHGYDQSICRVHMHGGVEPGKLLPDIRTCNVGWGGSGDAYHEFEVLIQVSDSRLTLPGKWGQPALTSSGPGAKIWAYPGYEDEQDWVPLIAGHDAIGNPIYACAAQHEGGGGNGEFQIGKVVAGNCNIEYGGREIILSGAREIYYIPRGSTIDDP
jgi:hypothetical protein